jgi:hypothetical protein
LDGCNYDGGEFELRKENVEIVSMDSISWPCNDDDECLDSPPLYAMVIIAGVFLPFALNG